RAITRSMLPGAEAAAFYSIPSFRAQLIMTGEAVAFALHDKQTLLKEWKVLADRALKKAKRRNEIAHGAVWIQFQEQRRERKIYIGPNMSDPRQSMKRKLGQDPEP